MTPLFKRAIPAAMAAGLAVITLAACSTSASDPEASVSASSTASSSANAQAAVAAFNKNVQEELNAVGCHAGPVDGDIGPESDAAIREFQSASGLPATGEWNAATESALTKAANEGKTVCTGAPTATATASVSLTSCTATALTAQLPSGTKITSFQCADGMAAVQPKGNGAPVWLILEDDATHWTVLKDKDDPCFEKGVVPPELQGYCDGTK